MVNRFRFSSQNLGTFPTLPSSPSEGCPRRNDPRCWVPCCAGYGGGSKGAWVPEKRSEKPNWENPRETERPNTGKRGEGRRRASGPTWLRNWLRQEVGRRLFSVCSWEPSWKVLWWVCVWKKGFNQAINICFFEVLWATINVTGRRIKSCFRLCWMASLRVLFCTCVCGCVRVRVTSKSQQVSEGIFSV